jgi:hypothetical protein
MKGVSAMKNRNWTIRALWFVLGFVVAGLLTITVPSHSEPVQDSCQEKIASLEQRVANLEQYNTNREKAEQEAARRAARGARPSKIDY